MTHCSEDIMTMANRCMRTFAEVWTDVEFVQQAVAQLPWGHNLVLLEKLSTQEARIWYAQKAIAVFDRVRHPIAKSYPGEDLSLPPF